MRCMTTQYNYNRGSGSGTLFAFVLAVVLGAAALVVFLRQATHGAMGRIASVLVGRKTDQLPVSVVVEKIQSLNRLETVVYTLDTVEDSDNSVPLLPDLLGADKLLMIVRGQTIAGFDLSQLKPDDVQITEAAGERTVHIVLPPSKVFLTAIDNQHTRVYSRSTGLLVPTDQNREGGIRTKAEQDLQKAALEGGILDAATKNGRATITAMLQGLGFDHVDLK
jgi:hypothetical protein